jgi:hypothetical protein
MSKKPILVLLFMMVFGTVSVAFGQAGASTAALKGLVTDPKGAVVPGGGSGARGDGHRHG